MRKVTAMPSGFNKETYFVSSVFFSSRECVHCAVLSAASLLKHSKSVIEAR